MLASTKGEIDLLEMNMLDGRGDGSDCTMDKLLPKLEQLTGALGGSMVVSAACTSSSAAAARAAALVQEGSADCVLVVACDSVTEFVYSGFSSLMALDKAPARPFDRNRAGLSVGEAAAFVADHERGTGSAREQAGAGLDLRMGNERRREPHDRSFTHERRADPGHHQGASRRGHEPDRIGAISAHGTGTVYNDAMEMRAFRSVFKDDAVPVYSIKGGIGHTMGAAGLVELIVALRSLRERTAPPTVNLSGCRRDAQGWVSNSAAPVHANKQLLMTNSGFSGINTALVLTGQAV